MKARAFLARLALTSLGVLVASQVVPGIECQSWAGLFTAALLLGLLNAFVRPLLFAVSLPLVVLSFGLFLWVINAGLLYFVGWLVKPFVVASFPSALAGSAVSGLVSWLGGVFLGLHRPPPHRGSPPPGPGSRPPDGIPSSPRHPRGPEPTRFPGDDPGGPVIDV